MKYFKTLCAPKEYLTFFRDFEREKMERVQAKLRLKQLAKQKENKQKMREYKSQNPDDTKSEITIEFEKDYEDDDMYGIDFEGMPNCIFTFIAYLIHVVLP